PVPPSPACPDPLNPQQDRDESAAETAHEWSKPTAMLATAPVATCFGVSRVVSVPSPSCPTLLLPQQYGTPPESVAQVCRDPAATVRNSSADATRTGTARPTVDPSPS